MRRISAFAALVLLSLLAVVCVRASTLRSRQLASEPFPPLALDETKAVERLSEAIRFRTVSTEQPTPEKAEALRAMHRFFERSFPRVHAALQREVVGDDSLLYTWRGADPSLPPMLLMAHLDVVPVEPGTEQRWTHPPFEGRIAGGFVWGRGTLDDKSNAVALLEAAEALLGEGFRPARTLYFAFGHDEERLGEGAVGTAALLKSRGVRLAMVLDEGGEIMSDQVPGVAAPVALVGTAEKRYVDVELLASGPNGHSSMPPAETAVGILAHALARLEDHPLPAKMGGAARELFDHLAPEMPFGQRLVFANLWLFKPLVERKLAQTPAGNAMIHTTAAPTMLEGSIKANVLPGTARSVVNYRLLPGDSVEGTLAHVRQVVADSRVQVRALTDPGPDTGVSPADGPAYALLARTIRQLFPDVVVAPYLFIGASDSRRYAGLSDRIYRFTPTHLRPVDLRRIHGTDERIALKDYTEGIRFFAQLIRNTGTAQPSPASP